MLSYAVRASEVSPQQLEVGRAKSSANFERYSPAGVRFSKLRIWAFPNTEAADISLGIFGFHESRNFEFIRFF